MRTFVALIFISVALGQSSPERDQLYAMLRKFSGFQMSQKVTLRPGQFLDLVLDQPEEGAFIDVVTPDASSPLVLTLPSGRVVKQGDDAGGEVLWTTMTDPRKQTEFSFLGAFTLMEPGVHRAISFERMPKGRYRIQVTGKATDVIAAIIPLQKVWDSPDALMPRRR